MQTEIDISRFLGVQTSAKRAEYASIGSSMFERFVHRKISDREKAEFCTQLAVMLRARISLHRALQVLMYQTKNPKLKSVIEKLIGDIQRGNSLARALARQSQVFDNLFIVTTEVGQESGRLAEVLSHLAEHLEKIGALKKKFVQALTYPALVIGVACLAVVFLLVFIVPTFAEMFKSAAGGQLELPVSTKVVLNLSDLMVEYGPYLLSLMVMLLLISRKTLRCPVVRQKIEASLLKCPIVGDIMVKNHVARFCRTLGTLLQAQVSLVDSLSVTQRIISSIDIRNEITKILKHVKQGNNMADPLVNSDIFPPMVAQMITVGEETSELDVMLLKVADYHEKELDGKVETLSSVIEPILILFLGLFVAAILISMYLPMFDLVKLAGGA